MTEGKQRAPRRTKEQMAAHRAGIAAAKADRAAKAAAKADVRRMRELQRQALADMREQAAQEQAALQVECDTIPLEWHSWGAVRTEAWVHVQQRCQRVAKRKRVDLADVLTARQHLRDIGTAPIDAVARIAYGEKANA